MHIVRRLWRAIPIVVTLLVGVVIISSGQLAWAALPAAMYKTVDPANCLGGNVFSVIVHQSDLAGDVYVKLASSSEPTTGITLYLQSLTQGQCYKIASATANATAWTKVTNIASGNDDLVELAITGNGLGAGPYQAVAQLLVLPDPSLCTPQTNCQLTFGGYSGMLQPLQVTSATDQISVFVAAPLNGSRITSVNYYDNGTLAYASKSLQPFNLNYLSSGVHKLSTVVMFSNGESFTVSQTRDLGSGVIGFILDRSLLYRSANKALVFALLGAVVVIIGLLLWIARLLYAHRKFKREHGLMNYSGTSNMPSQAEKERDKIVTG